MARKQAPPLVRFNFDSLTDTITNLTGTLILVVVLVMGIAGHVHRGGAGWTAREHTATALQEQLDRLQQQAEEVNGRIRRLREQCSGMKSRAGAMPHGQGSSPGTQAPANPSSPPAQTPQPPAKPTPPGGPLRGTSAKAGPERVWPLLVALHLVGAAPESPPAGPTTDPAFAAEARRRMLVQQLDTVVAAAAKVINGQTDSLAGLRREIETLRGQLGSAGPASPGSASKGQKGESSGGAPKGGEAKGVKDDGKKTESKGKEPPRKVTYRPPIEQFTTKTPIRFVCQNDRVSVLPLDAAFEARLQAFISAERIGQGQSKLFEFDLPKCDFLMRGVADKTTAQIEAVPKPGRPGETGDEIRKPGSLFRETLESTPGCSPKTHCVLFYVWPDSFDVYRKARSLVWETRVGGARYSEGWKAMLPAERIQFVRQPGRGGATPVQPY